MTREPAFVLATGGSAVVAEGVHTAYKSIADARTSLTSRSTPIIVGALPFDISRPAALIRPQDVQFLDALPKWPLRSMPAVRVAETLPEPDEHRARIAAAVQRLRDPASGLHKVVLARALRLVADGPLDARTIIDRLVTADPATNAYLADLTPAGADYSGTVLIGASPELLVARQGERVVCAPFAGSAPRMPDPDADRASGEALAASEKNRHEHALVVDAMRKALDPLCVDLQIPSDSAAEPHRRGLASVHADHWTATRKVDDRFGSRPCPASHPGGRRGAVGSGGGLDRRDRRGPGVLRGRGGLVRPTRRRPLGGVHPGCSAVGRPPHRRRARRRRDRRRIRS